MVTDLIFLRPDHIFMVLIPGFFIVGLPIHGRKTFLHICFDPNFKSKLFLNLLAIVCFRTLRSKRATRPGLSASLRKDREQPVSSTSPESSKCQLRRRRANCGRERSSWNKIPFPPSSTTTRYKYEEDLHYSCAPKPCLKNSNGTGRQSMMDAR